ncbi:MAG: pyrrolo-quinoline quinone [Clostridiales bacterium]|nr:pyrrolo-quinoline quinone [Clostridiales bacterium]
MSSRNKGENARQILILIALLLVCAVAVTLLITLLKKDPAEHGQTADNTKAPVVTADPESTESEEPGEITEAPTEAPTPEPTKEPVRYRDIKADSSATGEELGFFTELYANGQKVGSYTAEETVTFLHNDEYQQAEGVLSFRGSCFRQNPYYGTATVDMGKLQQLWQHDTYSVKKGEGGNYSGVWTGSGWTGQALVVRWDPETKAIMNMFESAKAKDGLVEVIYATMDGNIYFYDMETGEPTRNKIVMGVPFKGSGSLDPRGWPILYVGQGDNYKEDGKEAKAYIFSLINGKVLATVGAKPDSFAKRSWHAYDSACVVDGPTDTLFYPGENGIFYRVKLNTVYDKENGTLTMAPSEPVKARYQADRTKTQDYWLGYEPSAVAWRNYVYLCDNAGFMQCVDVNTMETLWVQDLWDDTNATPCLEEDPENGTAYLYVGNTLDKKVDANGQGMVAFFKIDACTGRIVWQKEYKVYTTSHITGGFQGSAVLGQGELEGLVITTYCSVGNGYSGYVVALDKETGAEVWSFKVTGYTWCSPVALYDAEGKAYIVVCNCTGNIYLLDGSGNQLDVINVDSNIEASPVAFDNFIVIGTRTKGIYGLKVY